MSDAQRASEAQAERPRVPIARGHPGGPTGLAQIWETTLQLRGEAAGRQVEDARIGLCHMMGGGSSCAIHMLKKES